MMNLKYKKERFKIGDKIKIIDRGQLYSTYEKMASYFKLKNWKDGRKIDATKMYKIIGIQLHGRYEFIEDDYEKIDEITGLNSSSLVLAIENIENGKQYLIGSRGVKKIYLNFHFDNEDFKI